MKRIARIALILQSALLLVALVYASHIVGNNDFPIGYALMTAGVVLALVYIAASTLLAWSAYKRAEAMPSYTATCVWVLVLTNWVPAGILLFWA